MDLITKKVKQCYEETPFPNTLQNSSDFEEELDKIIFWLKLNLKYLNLNDWTPHNILCAGCGTGEEAIALAKIFPNAHITAIDLSRASLEIAKKNIERAGLKIVLKQMSIYDLPQTKYDLVFCVGVIHHLSDPEKGFKVLSECARGKYIICLYNTYGLFFYKLQLKLLGLLPNRRK